MLGINSLRVLHHSREDILKFIKNGGVFRILMLDPTTDAFRERAEMEEDRVGRLVAEWVASAKILSGIVEKLHSSDGVEVKLYAEKPDRSLVMVDGIDQLNEDTSVLINYYPEQRAVRGYEGAQFLAQQRVPRDRDSVEKNWVHFAHLWENARSVKVTDLDQLHPE